MNLEENPVNDGENHAPVDENGEKPTFENDLPSVTITETYNGVGEGNTPDADAEPDSTSSVLTESNVPVELPEGGLNTSSEDTDTFYDGDSYISVTVTESKNAIQKAVDEALKSINENTTSITVQVAKGEYSGDISIQGDTVLGSNIPKDFVLYLMAEDSYDQPEEGELIDHTTANSDSAGDVVVSGNILIANINVIMTGLYLSKDKNIQVKDSQVTYNGTLLDDTVNLDVSGEDVDVNVSTGSGSDTVSLSSGGSSAGNKGTASIHTGSGDDVVQVDVSASNTFSEVHSSGGAGNDRMHLTGKLEQGSTCTLSDVGRLELKVNDSTAITMVNADVENYTDSLTGKREITITEDNLVADYDLSSLNVNNAPLRGFFFEANQVFVDYLLSSALVNDRVLGIGGFGFLSNLKVGDPSAELKIKCLLAPNLNVTLEGRTVVIEDKLLGKNITITTQDQDNNIGKTVSPVTNKVSDTNVDLGIMDAKTETGVTIRENALLKALGSVNITSLSKQTQPLLVLAAMSPVDVKLGTSAIRVNGRIEAAGSVNLGARSMFVSEVSSAAIAKVGPSLCVIVALSNTEVIVGETGSIEADGSVALNAESDLKVLNRATVGKLPISLAVTVVLNDVHATVQGSVVSGGDVTLKAASNSDIQTYSSKKAPTTENQEKPLAPPTNGFGGFFAIAVVQQDVDASVQGKGSIKAGGGIQVLSTSNGAVITKADSSMDPAQSIKSQSTKQLTDLAGGVFSMVTSYIKGPGGLLDSLQNSSFGQKVDGFLNKSEANIQGAAYVVIVEPTKNGSVTTAKKANGGDKLTIRATPAEGYTIDKITYTYLENGTPITKDAFTTRPTSTDVVIDMPLNDITIVATFRKLAAGDTPLTRGTGTIESGLGVSDYVDTATSGADGSFEAPEYGEKYSITTDSVGSSGTVRACTDKADGGQQVLVEILPGQGHRLSSLKLVTLLEGRTITSEIKANAQGQYIFTMPEGNVRLDAQFIEGEPDPAPETPSGSGGSASGQLVGAVAVAYVSNENDAFLQTSGEMTANGQVKVEALGTTQSITVADGSVVTEPQQVNVNTPSTQNGDGTAGDVSTAASTQSLGEESSNRKLFIGSMVNGEVEYFQYETATGTPWLALKVTPRTGYALRDGSLIVCYVDSTGKEQQLPFVLQNGDTYVVENIALGVSNITFTVAAQFDAVYHNIVVKSGSTSNVEVDPRAKTGDRVTVVVKNMSGKSAKFVFTDGQDVVLTIPTTANGDGTFTFVMPDSDIQFALTLEDKAVQVAATGDNAGSLRVQEPAYSAGDTVTILLTDDALASGKKFTVTAKTADGQQTFPVTPHDNGTYTFALPGNFTAGTINVSATAEETAKPITVSINPSYNGYVNGSRTAAAGDTLVFTVTADKGFQLKDNSLRLRLVQPDLNQESVHVLSADSNGRYIFKLADTYTGDLSQMELVVDSEFTPTNGLTGSQKKNFSAGVGINVTITDHHNHAYIKDTDLTANGLVLNAASGSDGAKVTSNATSRAGYSSGNFGVAGAITVHIATADTQARLYEGSNVTLTGGDLKVTASSVEDFTTAAEGSGSNGPTGSALGVGAGIATAITGVDVIARIDDETLNLKDNATLNTLEVKASQSGSETLTAKAGSAGGIAITPVLGLMIGGVLNEAIVGKLPGVLKVQRDAVVDAQSAMVRQMTANAAAAGGSVGVGGSFAISVLNDSSNAQLRSSVKANNVRVRAVSRSTMKSTSRAGANGAPAGSSGPSSAASSDSGTPGSDGGQTRRRTDKRTELLAVVSVLPAIPAPVT